MKEQKLIRQILIKNNTKEKGYISQKKLLHNVIGNKCEVNKSVQMISNKFNWEWKGQNKRYFNTYRNRSIYQNAQNNMNPNYQYMNNENGSLLNPSNYKYDPSTYYQSQTPRFVPNQLNQMNQMPHTNIVPNDNIESVNYQYFSIFGSTAMCLIKPVYPECVTNKNKITLFGKGGFQFVFMRRQGNTNKYDKNNKMTIFLKVNNLSSVLSLMDVDHLSNAITIKGGSNNYLIFEKHKEKKDHLVLRYKYQTTNQMNNPNFNDIQNTIQMDINENEQESDLTNESSTDDKKGTFEELHVSFPFSEFVIFQRAANLLLPHLLGWAKMP